MSIIELAKEAGLPCQHPDWTKGYERFAALVRERCYANARAERQWVDLTDDEMWNLFISKDWTGEPLHFMSAVIAAFKEKNK